MFADSEIGGNSFFAARSGFVCDNVANFEVRPYISFHISDKKEKISSDINSFRSSLLLAKS